MVRCKCFWPSLVKHHYNMYDFSTCRLKPLKLSCVCCRRFGAVSGGGRKWWEWRGGVLRCHGGLACIHNCDCEWQHTAQVRHHGHIIECVLSISHSYFELYLNDVAFSLSGAQGVIRVWWAEGCPMTGLTMRMYVPIMLSCLTSCCYTHPCALVLKLNILNVFLCFFRTPQAQTTSSYEEQDAVAFLTNQITPSTCGASWRTVLAKTCPRYPCL